MAKLVLRVLLAQLVILVHKVRKVLPVSSLIHSVDSRVLAEQIGRIAGELGLVARVLLQAAELGVSVADVEIAHSMEGEGGVLVLVVEAEPAVRLAEVLARGGAAVNVVPLA